MINSFRGGTFSVADDFDDSFTGTCGFDRCWWIWFSKLDLIYHVLYSNKNFFPYKLRRSFTFTPVNGGARGDSWELWESVRADSSITIPRIQLEENYFKDELYILIEDRGLSIVFSEKRTSISIKIFIRIKNHLLVSSDCTMVKTFVVVVGWQTS